MTASRDRYPRVCPVCKRDYWRKHGQQVYCSPACAYEGQQRKHAVWRAKNRPEAVAPGVTWREKGETGETG